jgi:endonuclease/exonuclease/phosphatase family metal-dependent hydrolase
MVELLKSNQVVAVQEHWLHRSEVNRVGVELLEHGICSAFKCYDDEDPVALACIGSGKGGIGLLWQESTDHSIEVLQDGSDRIMVALISTNMGPICLIAAYMPTPASNSVPEYKDKLLEVDEIVSKYGVADVIWCGDLNGSLHRNKYKHDPILQQYAMDGDWHLPISKYPEEHTFTPREGVGSTIDYFLVKGGNTSSGETVLVMDHPLCTSDHKPVKLTLNCCIAHKLIAQMSLRPPGRPQWHKADIEAYSDRVGEIIKSWTGPVSSSGYSVELATVEFISRLREAEKGTVPRPSSIKLPRRAKPPEWVVLHQELKVVYKQWCGEGRGPGSTLDKLKALKKNLRQGERQRAARRREELYSDITGSSSGDSKMFYRLVNRQRHSQVGTATTILEYNNNTYQGDDVTIGWAAYFSDLSVPGSKPEFDSDHYDMVNRDLMIYNQMADMGTHSVALFEHGEVGLCSRRLNSNKAADKFRLTAEHLKLAESSVIPPLTDLFNGVLTSGVIPTAFKEGILTPLLKKLKLSRKLPTNYRGITIICILGKILEFLLILRIDHIMKWAQNTLQRGFTSQVVPLYAALILMEVINEYKDNHDNLTLVLLDAEKAFDRVWHQGLFRRMVHIGIPTHMIGLMQDWYRGFRSQVRWADQISPSFQLHQGTIQGSGISPELFKLVNNPVLDAVTQRHLGAKIGTICCAVPTCADDTAVLASSATAEDVVTLKVVTDQLNVNRISINNKKTELLHYNFGRDQNVASLEINGVPLGESDSAVHLGI